MIEANKIYQGDSLNVLKTLPDESINCCMTSPPYWALRDYGTEPRIQEGLTDCSCNAGFSSGIVLDPFFGAGTTGLVALKQNKNFIGIELNPEYIKIAEARIKPYLEQNKNAK